MFCNCFDVVTTLKQRRFNISSRLGCWH